jgi:hypothetical protein
MNLIHDRRSMIFNLSVSDFLSGFFVVSILWTKMWFSKGFHYRFIQLQVSGVVILIQPLLSEDTRNNSSYMYVTAMLDRNASSILGPYYNTGPFSIQTLNIILFNTVFVTSGVILRPSSQFYFYFFSALPRKNMIKLTLMPQNAYLGSQKQWCVYVVWSQSLLM